MKNLLMVSLVFVTGCSAQAETLTIINPAGWFAKWVNGGPYSDAHNGPLELGVINTLAHPWAMTEVRALNDIECGTDLGTTSSVYDDPGNGGLKQNAGFLVFEGCFSHAQIKSNGAPLEFGHWKAMYNTNAYAVLEQPVSTMGRCPADMPTSGARYCTDSDGYVWVSTKRGQFVLNP